MDGGVFSGDPLEFWERDTGMRERVRPLIADEAKSNQFLAAKQLVLDAASRADRMLAIRASISLDHSRCFARAIETGRGPVGPLFYNEVKQPSGPVRSH